MSNSTSPCPDIDLVAPTVVEWESDDTIHYLAKPDPKIDDISLRIRFNEATYARFELRFPINLKGVDGVSAISLFIQPSAIISFDFAFASTVPDAVQEKFNCATTCLRFRMNTNSQILVPAAAREPLSPARLQSGAVLDAVRMLSGVTSLGVYIEATKLPKAQLQSISDAVEQARLKPCVQDDLASMYHGTGAKFVHFSGQQQDAPPSYNETEPPPPGPPINERKRRRAGSQDEGQSQIAQIWAELKTRNERDEQLQQQLTALKEENLGLRQEVQTLRQDIVAFRRDFCGLQRDVEQLCGEDKHTTDVLEGYDTRIVELRDDLEDLETKVDSIQEHRDENGVAQSFLDKVRSDVYDDIVTRLTG
ncbi:hypothetical protein FSARC_684 [Fusarium sarcochroum]|uniref:Uncharacterized protein n=1 Tax=Fusarium sarcochroum TaxID=1208366 RepID=A0A8H4XF60_9HYPO|nr:hypothetical protein FSARC_684 [Fusarium sarcochroum]